MVLYSLLNDELEPYQAYMHQDAVLCAFEDRQHLMKSDKDEIKRIGLSFKGTKSWPFFRRYIPGYVAWRLSAWECRLMTCVLKQSVIIYNEHISGKKKIDPYGKRLLTRYQRKIDSKNKWSSRESDCKIPSYIYKDMQIDNDELFKMLNISKKNKNVVYQLE